MLEKITSTQNPRIKQAIRLHSSRGRQSQGRIIVFGVREVMRALAAGLKFDELFVCETIFEKDLSDLRSQIGDAPTRVTSVTPDVFAKITYGDRVGSVVAVGPRPSTELNQLSLKDPLLVLVVQAIEKPGNLGAIIRTADACAVSAVLLADPLTDFFHPNAIRSSTGTVFEMAIACGTTDEVQQWLTNKRCNVFTAMLEENAKDCFDANLTGNVAIVLGNEANGLSQQWQQNGYCPVKLPMRGMADSLNVSVTAAVMMYEASRQRRIAQKS